MIRWSSLALLLIACGLAAAQYFSEVSLASAGVAITALLGFAGFLHEQFFKPNPDIMPLWRFDYRDMRISDTNVEFKEGDFAFKTEFEMFNEGSAVTDVEVIHRGRFDVRLDRTGVVQADRIGLISFEPHPRKGTKIKFYIKHRDRVSVKTTKFVYAVGKETIELA
jgi:hypothetical protein